ncbi:hypothetical protein F4819DRAFT_456340 [Hypoxylon fuscum]|nr:hypothetical protein F4819DRAFT_456340 [Hypoxylon fuscum]
MPRRTPNHDFDIYVDHSCLNTPMAEGLSQSQPFQEEVDTSFLSEQGPDATEEDTAASIETEEDEAEMMASNSDQKSAVRPSIEDDHSDETAGEDSERTEIDHSDAGDDSILSDRPDGTHDPEDSEFTDSHIPHDDGCDSSSHHEATDEDVFSDKSPRSSIGSYNSVPEPGKAHRDFDNMTTITRSPRISDISQYEKEYEKEEFVPTARGTPRPPFRTPSDVRAMQMSSPTPSVLGSPRSTKRPGHFPTVSRLGTPNAPAQYSPKRMSTPPRFKARKEAPLVLLHVTLLPLRWVWGDLFTSLETHELSEQTKALRESWRLLQDRIGDTVIERGILLGHPQNDYEVLEERLLEALELPLRRRARILECGHYLGPSNEGSIAEDDESEDEWGSVRSRATSKRHWCGTCKDEIRYDSLGQGKMFRVKVYASNGLMKAGAWAACWKEMERVDVELEPIVEPAVQDELVRLAAGQHEREFTHHEEAEIAKEVAQQMEEDHMKEHADFMSASSPQPDEPLGSPRSAEERRWRDEERLREIYGDASPSPSPHKPPSREPSVHPQQDSYVPPPSPSPRSPSEEARGHKEPQRGAYQNASFSELLLRSVRVLMQDRKNIIIFTLGAVVLILALRNAPPPNEPVYEPVIHRMRDANAMRRAPVMETPQAPPIQVRVDAAEPFVVVSNYGQPPNAIVQQHTQIAEPVAITSDYEESSSVVPQQHAPVAEPAKDYHQPASQHKAPEVESMDFSVESQDMMLEQHTTQPEPVVDEPDHQESLEAAPQQDTPVADHTGDFARSEDPFTVIPHQDTPNSESVMAAPSYEESLLQPTPIQENDVAAMSCATVYEPCSTPEGKVFGSPRLLSDKTDDEIMIERKVVRIVHTVTETEVETATETVKVTATEATKQSAPSALPEALLVEDSFSPASSNPEELSDLEATTEE